MAELINLRRVRKAKARAEAAQSASKNRAKHGMTKAARALGAADKARQDRSLDQAKRVDQDSDPD